jgi:hypothetical protein
MMVSLLAQQQQQSTYSPTGVVDRRCFAMSYNAGKASDLPAMPADTLKSQSIPISGAHRTASEVQLCEDEALADYRDFVVYSRIVNGISRQQERPSRNLYLRQENARCLTHIVSTRHDKNEALFDDVLGCDNRMPLQTMSHHIAQGIAMANPRDDYFCGEEPPESDVMTMMSSPQEEDDEDIFALEL